MTYPQQQAWGLAQQGHMVRDQKHNPAWIIVAWCVAVLSFGYMLPWAIAASRGKSNQLAVGLINLLLGWTVLGWVVALIMACGAHQAGAASYTTVGPIVLPQQGLPPYQTQQIPTAQTRDQLPRAGWYPAPDGSGHQAYWNGEAWLPGPRALDG